MASFWWKETGKALEKLKTIRRFVPDLPRAAGEEIRIRATCTHSDRIFERFTLTYLHQRACSKHHKTKKKGKCEYRNSPSVYNSPTYGHLYSMDRHRVYAILV